MRAILLLLLLAAPVLAEPVTIVGAGRVETLSGDGRSFTIEGAGHSITITGKANVVNVAGSENTVILDEVQAINLSGVGNKVSYKRGSPSIRKDGLGNQITIGGGGSAPVTPAAPTVTTTNGVVEIKGVSTQQTFEGQGRNFEIHGTSNNVVITGKSGMVNVHGTGNHVELEDPTIIECHGTGNVVIWVKGTPSVQKHGTGNVVNRK